MPWIICKTNLRVMLLQMESSAIFAILLLLCSLSSGDKPSCPKTKCAAGEPLIHFPFYLKYVEDEQCGSKGFDLQCNNQRQTVLNLSVSGDFLVSTINYRDKFVVIRDPDDCLARRFLSGFSLVGLNFSSEYYRNFTFLECPADTISLFDNLLQEVLCLRTDKHGIFAVPDSALPLPFPGVDILSLCSNKWKVTIPVQIQSWATVPETVRLKWDGSSSESQHQRISAEAIAWIVLGVVFPWPALFIWIYWYKNNRSRLNRNASGPVASTDQHLPTGMDGLAIELYPKTEVGDKLQLPRLGDNTCSICLSEYQSKEMIRTIPDCSHYFHAHCIDPWLKQNGSCPLCRNHQGSTSESITMRNSESLA